jgi:hypothetical protein
MATTEAIAVKKAHPSASSQQQEAEEQKHFTMALSQRTEALRTKLRGSLLRTRYSPSYVEASAAFSLEAAFTEKARGGPPGC